MEDRKEATYLSLFQLVRSRIPEERLTPKSRRQLTRVELFLRSKDNIIVRLAFTDDTIINVIDKYLIDLINDVDTLRGYFSKRFSPDFTEVCRKRNKLDKEYIEDEFENIGKYANYRIDFYERENFSIERIKEHIKKDVSDTYDKIGITGVSDVKRDYTSSKEVLRHIRDLYKGDFTRKQLNRRSPYEILKEMQTKSDSLQAELQKKGITVTQNIGQLTTFIVAGEILRGNNNRRLDGIDSRIFMRKRTDEETEEETGLEYENDKIKELLTILYKELFRLINSSGSESVRTKRINQMLIAEKNLGYKNFVSDRIDIMARIPKKVIEKDEEDELEY